MSISKRISTPDEAIDTLGGTFAVAELFGIDPRVVSNWRMRGLPPDTYAVMAPALAARGVVFSPQLFSQRSIKTTPPPNYPSRAKRQSKERRQALVEARAHGRNPTQ